MSDEATTQPMLEALLEGQRQIASQVAEMGSQIAEMRAAIATISDKQDTLAAKQDALAAKQDALAAKQDALAAKQDALAAKQDELAAKQDELAARQDRLEVALVELTREVRDGFDDTNRKIDVLNNRLLTFETRLKRVDDRLHDEIVARTR